MDVFSMQVPHIGATSLPFFMQKYTRFACYLQAPAEGVSVSTEPGSPQLSAEASSGGNHKPCA